MYFGTKLFRYSKRLESSTYLSTYLILVAISIRDIDDDHSQTAVDIFRKKSNINYSKGKTDNQCEDFLMHYYTWSVDFKNKKIYFVLILKKVNYI